MNQLFLIFSALFCTIVITTTVTAQGENRGPNKYDLLTRQAMILEDRITQKLDQLRQFGLGQMLPSAVVNSIHSNLRVVRALLAQLDQQPLQLLDTNEIQQRLTSVDVEVTQKLDTLDRMIRKNWQYSVQS